MDRQTWEERQLSPGGTAYSSATPSTLGSASAVSEPVADRNWGLKDSLSMVRRWMAICHPAGPTAGGLPDRGAYHGSRQERPSSERAPQRPARATHLLAAGCATWCDGVPCGREGEPEGSGEADLKAH